MLGIITAAAVAGNPTAKELDAVWQKYCGAATQHTQVPLPLTTESDWERLAKGETVTRRFRVPGTPADRVLAMRYIDQAPASIWVAILDGEHGSLSSDLVEWELPGATPTSKVLYQHLDLPFPVDNRHWIIHAVSNGPLYRATGRTAWERGWQLDPGGESSLARLPAALQARGDGAIWTPANSGAWLLLSVGWGTLAVYQLETNIGGWLPEDLVTRFVLSSLTDLIETTEKLADRTPSHYRSGHDPIYRPDGSVIEPYWVRRPNPAG